MLVPNRDDRVASRASLDAFFRPRSVALIGVSRDPMSIGHRLLDAMVKAPYQGELYLVHPTHKEIDGRAVFDSVGAIGAAIDLAVIAVPCRAVASVVADCAAHGIGALVIISAGFAEAGGSGKELQDQLLRTIQEHGMRLIGPNCLGLLTTDPAVCLNATFVPLFPPQGGLAISSDSGALGLAILAAAARSGLGISSFVSVGNRADVSSNDLLEYWEQDPRTNVILLYLESFGNPRRFARIARRVSRLKPIVAVKAGRTRAGQRAAGSHTAALASSEVAVDALFHQTGIIRAETLEEWIDLSALLEGQGWPSGRRVGILTNAGGPAILCADVCETGGLEVPELSDLTRRRLSEFLPAAAGLTNPVDMIASATPEHYRQALTTLLASGEVDSVICIYVSPGLEMTDSITRAIQETIVSVCPDSRRRPRLLLCLMPAQNRRCLRLEGRASIPCYDFPEAAARALVKANVYARWREQPLGEVPDLERFDRTLVRRIGREALRSRGAGWLSTAQTLALLQAAGMPIAAGGIARSASEAAALAEHIGFPVAVKLASQQIVHKTELGGVHLHLGNVDAVVAAFDAIRTTLSRRDLLQAMEGVLVQTMQSGTEVMVGVHHDPQFGPLIAFGLGGIHIEVLRDVCFRITPLTDRDAREMIRSIRGSVLFEGYRGHPPADQEALVELVLRVSRLVEECPEIREMDLNPVFAMPPGKGCYVADARVYVE